MIPQLISIKDLTPHERFWIWRRRRGIRREDVGAEFGVLPKIITAWERGQREDVPDVALVAELTVGEQNSLLRRRSGMTIAQLRKKTGLSHLAIIRRERGEGETEELLKWWQENYVRRDQ